MGGASGAVGTAVANHAMEESRREHDAVTETKDVKEEEEREEFVIRSSVKVGNI